jgi:hypothetical protein
MFNIPYFSPGINFGFAPVDYGQQAGSSHAVERATRPMIHPRAYSVALMGMQGAMPRYTMGATPVIRPNTYLGNAQTLAIPGVYKSSVGGRL